MPLILAAFPYFEVKFKGMHGKKSKKKGMNLKSSKLESETQAKK